MLQVREEDIPNKCKDREDRAGYADQRGFENRGIGDVKDQLPWSSNHGRMVQASWSPDWKGEQHFVALMVHSLPFFESNCSISSFLMQLKTKAQCLFSVSSIFFCFFCFAQIFNKSLLAKFAWAMDVDPDFRFWLLFILWWSQIILRPGSSSKERKKEEME